MDFNDPFDCRLTVNTRNSKREILRFSNSLCDNFHITDEERKIVTHNFMNERYRFEVANESIRDSVSKSGVSCFSKCNDSILMWSHYSNSHKGYCVKFDLLQDPDFFMIPVVVEYHKKYPRFNQIRDHKNVFNNTFGHKYTDWSYEKEIRVVRQEQGNIKIKKEAIVEIIFGIDCDDKVIESIKNLCKSNNYNHILLQKARIQEFEFAINFSKI